MYLLIHLFYKYFSSDKWSYNFCTKVVLLSRYLWYSNCTMTSYKVSRILCKLFCKTRRINMYAAITFLPLILQAEHNIASSHAGLQFKPKYPFWIYNLYDIDICKVSFKFVVQRHEYKTITLACVNELMLFFWSFAHRYRCYFIWVWSLDLWRV